MFDHILKVEVINNGISFSNLLSIFSTLLGIGSALYVFIEKYSQKKNEKMNLLLTPLSKVSNYKNSYFFIEFAFSNESSLPISLINFTITVPHDSFPDTDKGIGGYSVNHSLPIYDDEFHLYTSVTNVYSEKLPIVIPPYESRGGFIGFHIKGFDFRIFSFENFNLEITTSRSIWKSEMQVYSNNMSDFTYSGTNVIGKGVIQMSKRQKLLRMLKRTLKGNK